MAYFDAVLFRAASSGTGDFVVSSAITGYRTPAAASVPNSATGSYRAFSDDLTEWEQGTYVYTSGTTTVARTVTANSLGTTAKINFTAAPQVGFVESAADLVNASNLATGTVPSARLGSGGAGAGLKYLADDQTFKTLTNSGVHSIVYYTSSQTITIPANATRAFVEMVAPGGGSGGCAAPGTCSFGSTGSASAGTYLEKYLTGLTPGNTLSYTQGATGAGGAAGNNSGGTGGNSTLASGTQTISTLTCPGGIGSAGAASDVKGGSAAQPSAPTGGNVNMLGSPVITADTTSAQKGGHAPKGWGFGGRHRKAIGSGTGVGEAGLNYGAGAGGSVTNSGTIAGASGAPGILKITWLY